MRFRPCIDLHEGKVKQIVGATLRDGEAGALQTNFVSDRPAADYARLYRQDGLAGGHVIMLGPGNEPQALAALAAFPGGLQVGGGIRPENGGRFLDAGASHVIVTSYVFREGQIDYAALERLVQAVGRERLVLDMSCRRKDDAYYVVTDLWQRFTDFPVNAAGLEHLSRFCAEFLVHAVDVEGKRQGIEEALLAILADGSPVPVTYAGGVRSLSDLDRIAELGQGRVDFTIGSALDLFGGEVPYGAVVAWQRAGEKRGTTPGIGAER